MIATNLQNGFQKVLDRAGTQIRIRRYTETIGSVYDDDVTLAFSSDTWTSGIVLAVKGKGGSFESVLMEQGKLVDGDIKLFVSGAVTFTDVGSIVKVGIGSPVTKEYTPIPIGIKKQSVSSVDIYRKGYFRQINNGSLIGE